MKLLDAWLDSCGEIIVEVTVNDENCPLLIGASADLHKGILLFDPISLSEIVRFRINEFDSMVEVLTENGDVTQYDIQDISVFDKDYDKIESYESYELDFSTSSGLNNMMFDDKESKMEDESYNNPKFFGEEISDVKVYDECIEDPEKVYNSL